MQIIEVSVVGVRSAVLRLQRPDTPLRFVIYPMVHVGEPAFYAAVRERLRRCDLIVAEGVGRGSAAASALTETYRLATRFRRAGLVEQRIDYHSLGVPVLHPDLTGEQFDEGWRAAPVWERALTAAVVPVAALDRLVFGSRRMLARDLEETDLDWPDRMLDIDSKQELLALLTDRRDELLIDALDEIHQRRRHEAITVAVVYGAGHVAPVVHGMRALHGYGVKSAEWLTVFGF
jgi:hypothetical protein